MKGSRPLSDEEVRLGAQSFHGVYAAHNKVRFILGVRSGFRISEILSLRVGDVYQQGKVSERLGVPHAHQGVVARARAWLACLWAIAQEVPLPRSTQTVASSAGVLTHV